MARCSCSRRAATAQASCAVSPGSRIVTPGPRRVVRVGRGVWAGEGGRVTSAPDPRTACRTVRWSMWTVSAVRAARVRARTAGRRPRLRCASPFLLCEVGLTLAITFPFDRNDLGVVGEAIDERDGTGRVGKDRVPLLEHQIGCQHD